MDMSRPRFPYLHREISRHGKVTWYAHKRPAPRIRIKAEFGTNEFMEEYTSAILNSWIKDRPRAKGSKQPQHPKNSLSWLVEQYRQSDSWAALKTATRRQRDNIFHHMLARGGDAPYSEIDKGVIRAALDKKKSTPAAARNFLETARGLFRWALESQHISDDPTDGLKVKRKAGPGFRKWTDAEVAAFEAHWSLGTRERLAFDVLRYTGLRRGDVARLGKQHIKDGMIIISTEKTGELVTIPILPPLARSIAACPSSGLALIAQADGSPLVKESFGTWFRLAIIGAGLSGISAHGLRKFAATRAAENGATVAELESLFGWRGGGMASLYTNAANRAKLAKGAASKMLDEEQKSTQTSAPRRSGVRTLKRTQ